MEDITCDEALREISRALDGQCAADAARLEAHLQQCESCRREALGWRDLAELMARWEPARSGRSAAEVARRITAGRFRSAWLGAAAAVLCGIAVGGGLAAGFAAESRRAVAPETVLKEALRVDGAHSLERAFLAGGGS